MCGRAPHVVYFIKIYTLRQNKRFYTKFNSARGQNAIILEYNDCVMMTRLHPFTRPAHIICVIHLIAPNAKMPKNNNHLTDEFKRQHPFAFFIIYILVYMKNRMHRARVHSMRCQIYIWLNMRRVHFHFFIVQLMMRRGAHANQSLIH